MEEHFFQCPYCWEEISMLLEPSNQEQQYVEESDLSVLNEWRDNPAIWKNKL